MRRLLGRGVCSWGGGWCQHQGLGGLQVTQVSFSI